MNDLIKIICDLCREERIDGQSCFYKFPDAGKNGSDMDGFCCRDCGALVQKRDYDSLFERMRKRSPYPDDYPDPEYDEKEEGKEIE